MESVRIALSDPANYRDPQGLMAQAPGDPLGCLPTPSTTTFDCWGGDGDGGGWPLGSGLACLSGDCYYIGEFAKGTDVKKRRAVRQELFEAAIIAIAEAKQVTSPSFVWPVYLQVTSSCWTQGFSLTSSYTLHVAYQILDYGRNTIPAPNLAPCHILEFFSIANPASQQAWLNANCGCSEIIESCLMTAFYKINFR